ncbi:MAG: serine/threonine-protein kinase [Xenococcaceae cyanobacterium MO_207.B15]|nr:serine/threonine-protein kinase [Xenococcaceae cyanobacterium MO_207.B15]
MATSSLLRDGTILSDRYRIIKQIGRGGFGRTYLAEDTYRYNEYCVLKEFSPQVSGDREVQKAEALFEREAGILYKLKHDQIPRFEALLRTRIEGKKALFLVQQYIPGQTYWDLLKNRGTFSQSEITELLMELLPVLEYIHSQNLIHRDISPDNLIRRTYDGKPVLIDFGCVKLAANAVSQSSGQSVTLIGKKGYSPEEQMLSGRAFPNSDLYSLAATILVLLTGKSPEELYNSREGKWNWESQVEISSAKVRILNKMLAYRPRDRYKSATEVKEALNKEQSFAVADFISRLRTLIVAPKDSTTKNSSPATSSYKSNIARLKNSLVSNLSKIKTEVVKISTTVDNLPYIRNHNIYRWQWVLIIIGVLTLPGIASFSVVKLRLLANDYQETVDNTGVSVREETQQKNIYQRIQALELDSSDFYTQVDRIFYRQYPELKGLILTENAEHTKYRKIWYEIAENLLDQQEQKSSSL